MADKWGICSVCGKRKKAGTGGSRFIRVVEGGPTPMALYFYCSAVCHDRFQMIRREEQWSMLRQVA